METIKITLEKRRGKTITVLDGFTRQRDYLENLARQIKVSFGTGGTIQGNSIEIQGDFRKNLKLFLEHQGFQVSGFQESSATIRTHKEK